MKKNSILFSVIDREDYWVSSGLCIPLINELLNKTYPEIYKVLKPTLETEDIVEFVIKDNSLESKLFIYEDGEAGNFKFKETRWEYGLVYVFEDEYEERTFRFNQTDFILTL